MFPRRTDSPALPCPDCRLHGYGGGARIGNRRSRGCPTCNNFARNVDRTALKRLRELHEDEFKNLKRIAEMDLYPQVIEDFSQRLMIAERTVREKNRSRTSTGTGCRDE